jgi:hypothetical protein
MRGTEFYFYADRVCNPSWAYSICSHTRHYLGGDAYYDVYLRWPILRGIMRFAKEKKRRRKKKEDKMANPHR